MATTSTTAGDPVNVEEEVNAAPENVEEEVNVEQDTEVENALPPRRMRNDPEHEMVPMVPGSLGQRMRGNASLGMASAPPAQQVQQMMTALMQGQTIPLQYGRWVQWDQTSWVGSMQTYRYGVLNGLQVEMDFAQVGLMLRRPVVPGVTHSLALQGNVTAVPKSGLTRESTRSADEEVDPGVPVEHGMVQPGRKPPPQAWFQRQNMQDWMNRMAKPPAGPPPYAMPGPPPAGPPPHVMPAGTTSNRSTSWQGNAKGSSDLCAWTSTSTTTNSRSDATKTTRSCRIWWRSWWQSAATTTTDDGKP